MSTVTLTSVHGGDDATTVGSRPLAIRLSLAAGFVGPLLFFAVVLVEGATRPEYNAWHHVISTLALGPGGWVLSAGLLVLGMLLLCFAVGLRWVLRPGKGSTWGPILIAVTGFAFIAQAGFVSDPALGYPPASPATSTLHGILHNILSAAFETPAVVAACVVLCRRFAQAVNGRRWVIYSIGTIAAVVLLQVVAILAYVSSDPNSLFGLFQRLQFFALQGWIAVLALRLLSGPPFEPRPRPDAAR